MRKLKKEELLYILTTGILLLAIFSAFQGRINKPNQGKTASVLTFAYDFSRSGKAESLIEAHKNIKINRIDFKPGYSADPFMPLYVNGFFLKKTHPFYNKRVIIFADETRLKAVDIDRDSVIWEIELPLGIKSTPVIHLENDGIYALANKNIPNPDDSQNNIPIYHHELYLIKMDGSIRDRIYIDLAELMKFKGKKKFFGYAPGIHCRTALGLNLKAGPPYVYFGCSIRTRLYKSYRGVHGSVIQVELNKDGAFKGKKNMRAFLTSVPQTDNKMTGFDTGVYNAGAAISSLSDGSLLVATGNGPVYPGLNNFGCSVVLIDGSNLKIKRNDKGQPFFFSIDKPPNNECWYENAEYTNSSAASIKKNGIYYSAVISKHGWLTSFNPYTMDNPEINQSKALIGEMESFGQPVIFINSRKQVNVFAVSNFFSEYPDFSYQEFLTDTPKKLSKQDKIDCFGYIAKSNSKNSEPLYLMYSGSIRDVYINSTEDENIHKSLTTGLFYEDEEAGSEDSWSPFFTAKTLGYVWTQKFFLKGYKPKRLNLVSFLKTNKLWDILPFKADMRTVNKNFYVLEEYKNSQCENKSTFLKPLYKITRQKPANLKRGLYAYSFIIQDNHALKRSWRFKDNNLFSNPSSPVLSENIKNKDPVFIFTAGYDIDHNSKSLIVFLNGRTGRLIGKASFPGEMYFSMPLIVDNLIFIPTRSHGIQKFSIKSSHF